MTYNKYLYCVCCSLLFFIFILLFFPHHGSLNLTQKNFINVHTHWLDFDARVLCLYIASAGIQATSLYRVLVLFDRQIDLENPRHAQ